MFRQIHNTNPKFKLALNKPSSHKKRSGAPVNKENIPAKRSALPVPVKRQCAPGERSAKTNADHGRQKRQSAYTFTDSPGSHSVLADLSSDSLYVELADSIRMDFDYRVEDRDEDYPADFGMAVTSTPPRDHHEARRPVWPAYKRQVSAPILELGQAKDTSAMDDTFDLSDYLRNHSTENLLDVSLPTGIRANDSIDLARKRLAASARRVDDDDDDYSFDFSQVLDHAPEERLMDTSLSSLMDVEINYSLEFPTGALNWAPHISVPKFKRDMKRRAALERLAASARRVDDDDDDYSFDLSQVLDNAPEERLMDTSLSSIMDVEINYSLEFPTGALNWAPHISVPKFKRDMKRKAALERFADSKMESLPASIPSAIVATDQETGCTIDEVPGVLVTSPSDGDLCLEIPVEEELTIQDVVVQSYKSRLLDSSLHNWNMRFNF